MNEKTKAPAFDDPARGCERAPELVSYLYGEASHAEANLFRAHLDSCEICHAELAAFAEVRTSVGVLREEAYELAPSLDVSGMFAPISKTVVRDRSARSAWAALREFFSLSPVWLKAGTATAMLALCALAALAVARTEVRLGADGLTVRAGAQEERTVVQTVKERVEVPVPTGVPAEQIDALVEERLESELVAARERWEAERAKGASAEVANRTAPRQAPRVTEVATNTSKSRRAPASSRSTTNRPRPVMDVEETLPRLSDLLSGVY